MTDRELMQQALDALDKLLDKLNADICDNSGIWDEYCDGGNAMQALRARLAQPEPEPVTMVISKTGDSSVTMSWWHEPALPVGTSLYTAPPQREWQTLTENEIKHLWYEACQTNLELTSQLIVHLARNIEAKLKEKNHG